MRCYHQHSHSEVCIPFTSPHALQPGKNNTCWVHGFQFHLQANGSRWTVVAQLRVASCSDLSQQTLVDWDFPGPIWTLTWNWTVSCPYFLRGRVAPSGPNNKVKGTGGLIPHKSKSAVIKCGKWGTVGWGRWQISAMCLPRGRSSVPPLQLYWVWLSLVFLTWLYQPSSVHHCTDCWFCLPGMLSCHCFPSWQTAYLSFELISKSPTGSWILIAPPRRSLHCFLSSPSTSIEVHTLWAVTGSASPTCAHLTTCCLLDIRQAFSSKVRPWPANWTGPYRRRGPRWLHVKQGLLTQNPPPSLPPLLMLYQHKFLTSLYYFSLTIFLLNCLVVSNMKSLVYKNSLWVSTEFRIQEPTKGSKLKAPFFYLASCWPPRTLSVHYYLDQAGLELKSAYLCFSAVGIDVWAAIPNLHCSFCTCF